MKENKNLAFVVLGIISVTAIVSLVIMFSQNTKSTGAFAKLYGGDAVKGKAFPYNTAGNLATVGNRFEIIDNKKVQVGNIYIPKREIGSKARGSEKDLDQIQSWKLGCEPNMICNLRIQQMQIYQNKPNWNCNINPKTELWNCFPKN